VTGRYRERNKKIVSKERRTHMKFNAMFQPIEIGPMTVRNRFVVPPMGNNFANTDGTMSEQSAAYYRERVSFTVTPCHRYDVGNRGPSEIFVSYINYSTSGQASSSTFFVFSYVCFAAYSIPFSRFASLITSTPMAFGLMPFS